MDSLISPAKRQVLAGLVNARKTIKKKFNRAYTDRIKRERKLKETFKPITASIDALSKSTKKSKKSEQDKKKIKKKKRSSSSSSSDHGGGGDDVFETEQFRPKRQFAASTPRGAIRKRLSYSDGDSSRRTGTRQRQNQTTGYSDFFQSAIGGDSGDNSSSTIINASTSGGKSRKTIRTPTASPSKFGFQMPTLTRSDVRNLKKLDTRDFDYSVSGDFDSPRNYDKQSLPDAAMVKVKKTDKASGLEEDIVVRFVQLPESAKREWIKQRKEMYPQINRRRSKRNDAVEERRRQTTTDDNFSDDDDGEPQPSTSQQTGRGLNNSDKLIDFNFIPYNVKNRIIYEYFDDPNELCDRLQLLVSSRLAGNTNHMQEINSIIEELQELGCIA